MYCGHIKQKNGTLTIIKLIMFVYNNKNTKFTFKY